MSTDIERLLCSGLIKPLAPFGAGGFLYAGQPKLNSGLSNHLVTLTVNTKPSQQAHIQTFFSALANNYPSASADYTASSSDPTQRFYTPNWFYYYNQIYTATGKYQVGDQTYTDFTASPYTIHIEDQTYGTIGGIHIYALKPGANTISWAGDIQLSGAWLYIMICAHEKEHQDACSDGTYAIDKTNPSMPVILTSDNDRLDNTWEDNHYFDSTTSNTTGAPAYGNETDAPDDEAIADIVGLGKFLDAIADWKQDWAGAPGGANYGGGYSWRKLDPEEKAKFGTAQQTKAALQKAVKIGNLNVKAAAIKALKDAG